MPTRSKQTPAPDETAEAPLRDRMEIVRFKTQQDLSRAMAVFWEAASPDIQFAFRGDWPEGTCVTNTATVRALQALNLPFEWLTEHLRPERP